jgi:hypothetical protein
VRPETGLSYQPSGVCGARFDCTGILRIVLRQAWNIYGQSDNVVSMFKALQESVKGVADHPFLVNATACILDTVADGLLVHIQSDVIHMSFEEPPWVLSESTCPLSSALSTPRAPPGLSIQTVSLQFKVLGPTVQNQGSDRATACRSNMENC